MPTCLGTWPLLCLWSLWHVIPVRSSPGHISLWLPTGRGLHFSWLMWLVGARPDNLPTSRSLTVITSVKWFTYPWVLGIRRWTPVGNYSACFLSSLPAEDGGSPSGSRQFHSHPCRPGCALCFTWISPRIWQIQTLHQSWLPYSSKRVDYVLLSNQHSALRARERAPLHLSPHTPETLFLPSCDATNNIPDQEVPHWASPWPTLIPCLDHFLRSLFLFKGISIDMKTQLCSFGFPATLQKQKSLHVNGRQTLPSTETSGDLYSKHPHLIFKPSLWSQDVEIHIVKSICLQPRNKQKGRL